MRQASDRSHLRLAHSRGPAPMGMPPFNPGRRPTRPLTPLPPVRLTSIDWFGAGIFLASITASAIVSFLIMRSGLSMVFGS